MSKRNLNKITVLTKWNSAGNTFIILNGKTIKNSHRKELTKKICDLRNGLAADGCLFLKPLKNEYDYEWDFYNSDGSIAEMCGNAARAADQFCRQFFKTSKKNIRFKTLAGRIVTWQEKKSIYIEVPEIKPIQKIKTHLYMVNTGVPHLVWEVKNLNHAMKKIKEIKHLRQKEIGKQKGFNVTLVEKKGKNFVRAVTFERGVEDFTLSCGTGALAAALFANQFNKSKNNSAKIKVQMPGGVLFVSGHLSHWKLIGETKYICKAEMNL